MYRIRTIATGVAGSPWYINMYFGAPSGSEAAAATAVGNFWSDIHGSLSSSVSYTVDGTAVDIDPATGKATSAVAVPTRTVGGSEPSKLLPTASQALVRLKTGAYVGGRQVQGKLYIPGLTVGGLGANGLIDGATMSTFTTAVTTRLVRAQTSTDPQLCVYSRKGKLPFTVTGVSGWTEFAVLRSRRD